MKWKPTRRNPNLEDRRGQGGGGGGFGLPGGSGGGMNLPIPTGGKGGMGIGTILIIIVLFFVLRELRRRRTAGGFDVPSLPSDQAQVPPAQQTDPEAPPAEGEEAQDQGKEFVNFVLTDLEAFWAQQFQSAGRQLHARRPGPVQRRGPVRLRPGQLGHRARSTARSTRRPTWT